MRYLEAKPHFTLRDWVKCYWFMEKDYAGQGEAETIFPDGCIDLLLNAGNAFHPYPTSVLIGPLNQALSLPANGKALIIGIRFYAYGIYPFLREPLHELTNQAIDAKLLFGATTSELTEKVMQSNPQAAFKLLDTFLLARLGENHNDTQMVKATMPLLWQLSPIKDVAKQVYIGSRSLERKFKQVTGFSPKMLARVLRFNRLKNDLMLHPGQNLTDLAHRHLYFDQAHFNHDFHQFTGQTPSQFVREVENGTIRFYR